MIQSIQEILISAFVVIVPWFFFSAIAWSLREEDKGYSWYKGKITTNYNAIAFIYNVRKELPNSLKKLKPKSKIDRDIERELKKIRKEEKEIESMKELERLINLRKELEKRKEQLFRNTNGVDD